MSGRPDNVRTFVWTSRHMSGLLSGRPDICLDFYLICLDFYLICLDFCLDVQTMSGLLSGRPDICPDFCLDVQTYVRSCPDIEKSMILRCRVVENIRKISNRCILSIKWPFVYSVRWRLMGSIAETLCINPEQKIFSFDSVLPSESCLRAPLPPKNMLKKKSGFFSSRV